MLPFILTIGDETKQKALEELYNTHSIRMYNSAYKILENKHDAEDALQDTFIKIYKNIDKFMSLSGDDLILLIIIYTRNTARDIRRRKITEKKHTSEGYYDDDGESVFADISDPDANVEEIVINKERIAETRSFIDSLPTAQRDVIIMKYRLGMREKEIAKALGISETAVSSRVLRAKDSLRKMMKI
ncbi:MAG: sigma-70 family RNA polymerase sigma factor [Ruminococcaceae bacterium]|nr:sigma-70 family RNA polymerase sigma factor [Oscillospiraceae bacterium]